ncbi:MAG: creatininase family protein, partial [Armatimonadota bacterium]|nr:creatininase family protein [Armatimonadota bacterium]
GFDTFVLLSSHGGNFDALEIAARRLREEFGQRGIRIVEFAGRRDLMAMSRLMVETAAGLGALQDVEVIHADATETSIMMRLHPHLVDAGRLERGLVGPIDPDDLFRRGLRAVTPNGIIGDATLARPELGEVVLDRLADYIAAAVRERMAPEQT